MSATSAFSPKITASDRAIEEALREAHLPSLMAALVHLTGDASDIAGEWRPVYDFFGDGQGGLSEEMQTRVRQQALAVICRLRDGSPQDALPDAPSRDRVRQMMDFVAGQSVPDHYIPFLFEELDLADSDAKARDWFAAIPLATRQDFPVIVVGAGMSGILAAIRLEEAGIPYTVIEKNADVGGTWYENSYPGCRVDTPNHLYSYSFGANHSWPQHYSTQGVLLDYFRDSARDHGVLDHVRFRTSVTQADYDEQAGVWRVRIRGSDGSEETLSANALISAVGQLNRPKFPDIPGLDSFEGISFHSAEWEHEHDFKGKRVAVIGTGASAFQFVPEIADQPSQLLVFQRSAPWLGPTPNYHDDVADGMKWLLEHVPYYEKWYRFWLFWMMTDGILPAVQADPDWQGPDHAVSEINDGLRAILTEYIRSQVGDDPELFAAAVPDYPPGGKRMLRDNGVWFGALKRDNVQLISRSIREVTSRGIVTDDGTLHEVDVIIYGTGFHASEFLSPMKIVGRGGVELNERWSGDARAYLGITIPSFPNLFCMYGPNTNIVVNGSIIFFSECEIRYILGCLQLLLEQPGGAGACRALECKSDVHDAFNRLVDEGNAKMAWGVPQVSSWYKNSKGRVSQNWPFALVDFWNRTQAPDPGDFEPL